LGLYFLIIFQWAYTIIYTLGIILSFWKLDTIKFLIIAMPIRIGVALYDFEDNRLTMKN
jgi:hypothetical protein